MSNRATGLGVVLLACLVSSLAVSQQSQVAVTPQQSVKLIRLLEDASTAVNQIPEWGIKQGDLMDLVGLYSAVGKHARAHAIVQTIRNRYQALSEATASGRNPPPGMYSGARSVMQLSMIASLLAQYGDLADALDIVKELGYDNRTAQAINMIAIYQVEDGDLQGALQTAGHIPAGGFRDGALGQMVYWELHRHNVSGALAAAADIPSSPEKVHQLIAIAHAELAEGEREAALSTITKARKIAAQLPERNPPGPQNFTVSYVCAPGPNNSPRDQALQYVAQGQWELGDYAAATAIREQIRSTSLKQQTLYNFINADAGMNRFAEAAGLLGKLPAGQCRNSARAALASAEVAAGDLTNGVVQASKIQPPSSLTWTDLAMKAKDPSAVKLLFARARADAANVTSDLNRAEDLAGIAALERMKGLNELACSDAAEAVRLDLQAHARGESFPLGMIGFISGPTSYAEANYLVKCGKVAQAQAVALKQEGLSRENVIGNVAAVEAANGDARGAETWAQSLTSPTDRASALIGIATAILDNARMQKTGSYGSKPSAADAAPRP